MQDSSTYKVLLIVPCSKGVHGLSGLTAVANSGLLAIAGYCRQFFPNAIFKMRDFGAERISLEEQLEQIGEIAPDIIGITSRSFLYAGSVRLASGIKERYPNIRIAYGGPHPTLMPHDTEYPDCFDCVVKGEGEPAFRDLLQLYEDGRPWPKKMIPPYLDESELTFDYAWDMVENPDIFAPTMSPFNPDKMGSVVWSRGCPFNCVFCAGPALWKGSKIRVRYRSSESIINELRYLRDNFGIRRLFVHDDTLNTNPKRLEEILKAIIEADLGMIWYASGLRANKNMLPEYILPLLRKAGCRVVNYGIESGSEVVLDKIHRQSKLSDIERALTLTKKHKIKNSGSFTIGHIWREPDGSLGAETEEQIKETVSYIKKIVSKGLLWTFTISTISPVPGSETWNIARENKLLKSDNIEDLEDTLTYERLALNFDHPSLDGKTLQRHAARAYRLAIFSIPHLFHAITTFESWADIEGAIKTFFYMMQAKLFVPLQNIYLKRLQEK